MSTHPTATGVCFVRGRRERGAIACLTLGMQLQVSPSTATDPCFAEGRQERVCGRSEVVACQTLGMQLQVLPQNATACLPKELPLTFFVGARQGGGVVACLIVGMQLQISPSTLWCLSVGGAIACLPLDTQLQVSPPSANARLQCNCNFMVFCRGGAIACLSLGMQL